MVMMDTSVESAAVSFAADRNGTAMRSCFHATKQTQKYHKSQVSVLRIAKRNIHANQFRFAAKKAHTQQQHHISFGRPPPQDTAKTPWVIAGLDLAARFTCSAPDQQSVYGQ